MKIRIELTDDSGQTFSGEMVLEAGAISRTEKPHGGKGSGQRRSARPVNLDFGLPLRAFLKACAKGRSGAAKFTIVLAHLTKGKTGVAVKGTDIERAWNSATSHLGAYNPAHTTRAKDNGWVDSRKHGEYVLLPQWKSACER